MSYQGIITKIVDIKDHPNADRLNIGKACNFGVIISKDVKEGELGLFFQEGGCLSMPFLKENNLYRHKELNKNPEESGLFEDNGRIRAARIRGIASEGFWIPIKAITFTGIKTEDIKDGLMFTTLNGVEICKKYETKSTKEHKINAPKIKKMSLKKIYPQFQEHFDTQQLKYYVDHIPVGAVLSITEKLHGTSGRTGHLLKKPNFLLTTKPSGYLKGINPFKTPRRFFSKLKEYSKDYYSYLTDMNDAKSYIPYRDDKYDYVTGTRRVILNLHEMKDTFYEGCDFRTTIHNWIATLHNPLPKDMTLYYEIVGFTDNKTPIMGSHGLKKDMKELKALYGDTITFSYGCNREDSEPFKIYIYRVTLSINDGQDIVDLSHCQTREVCESLDLDYVPVLKKPFIYDGDKEKLLKLCEELANGPSTLDSRHLREGIVLKVEHPGYNKSYKFKSFDFLVLEGVIKDNEAYTDEEEVQSEKEDKAN